MKAKKNIGVFDSGFGGVHILRNIVKHLPQYNYIYLGDTARTPYGSRSKEVVYEFTKQAVDFLFRRNCDLVIIACNTASSDALRKVQREYIPKKYSGKNVLGVLIPAAEEAIKETERGRIGVIATEGTVRSGAFTRELKKLNRSVSVFQNSAPLIVPLIEAGEHKSKLTPMIIERYLTPLIKKDIDTLILGCTHYGILEKEIKEFVGPKVRIISEGKIIPKKLEEYLARHDEFKKNLKEGGIVTFYSTDVIENFAKLGGEFFGKKIHVIRARLE